MESTPTTPTYPTPTISEQLTEVATKAIKYANDALDSKSVDQAARALEVCRQALELRPYAESVSAPTADKLRQAELERMLSEALDPITFHAAWGQAKDRADYCKDDWKRSESRSSEVHTFAEWRAIVRAGRAVGVVGSSTVVNKLDVQLTYVPPEPATTFDAEHVARTRSLLDENGIAVRESVTNPGLGGAGRLTLINGAIVMLYLSGRACLQGKATPEDDNIKALLRADGWTVK